MPDHPIHPRQRKKSSQADPPTTEPTVQREGPPRPSDSLTSEQALRDAYDQLVARMHQREVMPGFEYVDFEVPWEGNDFTIQAKPDTGWLANGSQEGYQKVGASHQPYVRARFRFRRPLQRRADEM